MRLLFLLVFFIGCASSKPQLIEYKFDDIPEKNPLPVRPQDEDLNFPDGEDLRELAFDCPSDPYICVTDARAARDILFRIKYNELRDLVEEDRRVWESHRAFYDGLLEEVSIKLAYCERTWWEDHKFYFGLGTGFAIGLGSSILIMKILNN